MKSQCLTVVSAVALVALAAAATNADAQPRPRNPKTGYDIAITHLRSTGPDGAVPNAIVPTFKNVGTKTITVPLRFRYQVNGGGWLDGQYLKVSLAPGETHTIAPKGIEAGFVKHGDTVEGFIDADEVLAEDNEKNNRMTKLLEKPVAMPRR